MFRMENLPPEIIERILWRLRIKSLVRFRCVSKSWYSSVLPNKKLSELRFHNAPQKPLMNAQKLLTSTHYGLQSLDSETSNPKDDYVLTQLEFPFHEPDDFVDIVGSCNGIVCVVLDECKFDGIFLWNPSTGIYRKLPNPEIPDGLYSEYYGFGYDSVSNDYKIVVATSSYSPELECLSEIMVFSLKSNSWKSIPEKNPHHGVMDYFMAILSWNALHWYYREEGICAFDLGTEEFYTLPLPNTPNDIPDNLGIYKGCLFLTLTNIRRGTIMVMKEYGVDKSWVQVKGWERTFGIGSDYLEPVPLCFTRGGACVHDAETVITYNPEDQKTYRFKSLCDPGYKCGAIPYVEDVTSPYAWN